MNKLFPFWRTFAERALRFSGLCVTFALGALALAVPFALGLKLAGVGDGHWLSLQSALGTSVAAPHTLRVGVVTSHTISREGMFPEMQGYERALVEQFARHTGRTAHYTSYSSSAAAREALSRGEIDLSPIGFTSESNSKITVTSVKNRQNPWIIAYSPGTPAPKGDLDLTDVTVIVLPRIAASEPFADLKARFPSTRFIVSPDEEEETLLGHVDTAAVRLALIDADALTALQHIYTGVGRGFTVHDTQRAWLTRATDIGLAIDVYQYGQLAEADRSAIALHEQYFGHTESVNSFDANTFEARVEETLPKWSPKLKNAQDLNGIDWRLLAAVAYQESQWQPAAVSYTGVWGFMQLTQDTANMYRVDRRDPAAAIAAGAKHLAYLHRATPDRIPEPDRSFMALAAYNVGLGHVEDARILAQRAKTNPDRWSDVKAQFPKLTDPKVAATTKHGLARGYEAVEYVDRIRAFYEILARHEDPHAPFAAPNDNQTRTAQPKKQPLLVSASVTISVPVIKTALLERK